MPKDLLSDAKVRTAKPAANRYKLSDGGGLFLLIQPTGSKLWRWKFRLDGKENLFAIGAYPEVSLAEARTARDAARHLVKQGVNPSQHRKDGRQRNIAAAAERKRADALADELSFAKVSAAYLGKVKADYTLDSYRSKESRIRKFLSPKLDTLSIAEIGAKEIRPILEDCEEHGAWAGIRVKGDLSAIFQYAVIRGLVETNPIPGLGFYPVSTDTPEKAYS